MGLIVSAVLVVVGVIHILPLAGVLSRGRLSSLYGITAEDPNLEILLRHRAVLFGLLGAFLIYSAAERRWQSMALLAGGVSVLSFLLLARSVGGYNASLSRVVVVDIVAAVLLVIAAIVHLGVQ